MKVKVFSKSQLSFSTPDLLSLQKNSWQQFWEKDLRELLEEVFPIYDYTGSQYSLNFIDFKLKKPKYENGLQARFNEDSYEAPLFLKLVLTNLKTKEKKEQEVFLANFPVMTERGAFVINGVSRVVISQLIRSPGVFFTKRMTSEGVLFGAKIIPSRGSWLEFETELSGAITVKINRQKRVLVTTLLLAFGIPDIKTLKEKFKNIDKGETKYIEKTLKREGCLNSDEAVVEIYRKLRPGEYASPDAARNFVFNMFRNFSRYDLSKVGRWKMWQRLEDVKPKKEKEITKEDRILNLADISAVASEIIKLNSNPLASEDEIDHLGNRRVRTFTELFLNRLRVGFMRMERIIKDKMSILEAENLFPAVLINQRPLIGVIQEFFASSQFSQFMDEENPLAEVEHKRRLTTTGPGGLTRERAGFEVRDVQPSHYGRICPIETPEGQNVGLINHLACFTKVNPYGFLVTPYFRVEKGKVLKKAEYLNAFEEEKYAITHAGTNLKENREIKEQEVEARKKGEPIIVERNEVDYMDVSSKQPISVSTALIPFLQNNDANRALMGSNMQRQAVPLIISEAPLVGTGMERKVASDSGEVILAEEDGVITFVDGSTIKLKTKKHEIIYKLRNFIRSNQYTCFQQKPAVSLGQKVKKGEILADGTSTDNGRLALGKNLLVAFLPFRGGNFEDALCISDRLLKEDVFTSAHIEDFTCDVRETKLGAEITTSDIPNVSEERLKDLDEEGIIRVGAEVKQGDILVGKISPKGETELTPEERLLRAIFGEKGKEVKDTSLRVEHGKRGRIISVKVFSREKNDKLEPGVVKKIRIEIGQIRKIKAGDKLAGRHGNKGVVAKILPPEEMPFLEDGTPVDIVVNPLSVLSRMNVGQILETHLGWAAKKLGYLAISPALLGANEKDIKEELKRAGLPESGQTTLYDGKTGLAFPTKVTIGYLYMMKLIHMVEDKIHMRSIGPYSLITQQPLGGKAQFGGQRFGEMEVWALEGYGASHVLQEVLTIKSDDVFGRIASYEAILKGEPIKSPNIPASFNLLVAELKSLGLAVEIKEK